ncbi:hypothetical protein C364_06640 [Cryptococcus neoformans Bt63]|nr:hypothetical protein C364_06640 [Cryptococcus neoformans var. grubii Bt63]
MPGLEPFAAIGLPLSAMPTVS